MPVSWLLGGELNSVVRGCVSHVPNAVFLIRSTPNSFPVPHCPDDSVSSKFQMTATVWDS